MKGNVPIQTVFFCYKGELNSFLEAITGDLLLFLRNKRRLLWSKIITSKHMITAINET